MDIKRMIAIVQLYIGMRKGVDIKGINIRNASDLIMLSQAYNTATNWMNSNNVTVKTV